MKRRDPDEERDERGASGQASCRKRVSVAKRRELAVGPAEEPQQLVERAVRAEDLREERAGEDEHEREVDARRARPTRRSGTKSPMPAASPSTRTPVSHSG